MWNWQPSVATAALWLLTATALLVVWYQIPVHDWQRAIMLGLAPYLLVFVVAARHAEASRLEVRARGRDRSTQLAYLALVLFWAWAAWRRDSSDAAVLPARRVA